MTRAETAAYLAAHDRYCLVGHLRPDGDTLGSTAALCLGLRKIGKTADILEDPQLSGKLSFLHDGLTKGAPDPGDILISVDVSSRDRLCVSARELAFDLRIDHHRLCEPFTERELVDADAAACGEIVYDLLRELGVTLDREIAEALYVAVSTDTGCFRFANTTAHTYEVAAACASTGAALWPITRELFDTNSLTKLKIRSWIVENARFFREGTVALCAMPFSVEKDATVDDMDDVSAFLRSIEGVRVSALLRETESGVKLSVRAVPGLDATAVCAGFGGGGHAGAAGATFDMPLAEAEKAVEALLLELF